MLTVKQRNWKILDRGAVPVGAPTMSFACPNCDREAEMPVIGRPLAQLKDGGIVFDNDGPYAGPELIRCPFCRHTFEKAKPKRG